MPPSTCAICAAENRDEVEQEARLCLEGARSWRSAGEATGFRHQQVKNHMEKHWMAPAVAVRLEVQDEQDADIQRQVDGAVGELLAEMESQPATLKPMYLAAIHNVKHITDTKPSQQHLVAALKAVHEITGMKMEQRMLLEFGAARFGKKLPAVTHSPERDLLVVNEVLELEGEEVGGDEE